MLGIGAGAWVALGLTGCDAEAPERTPGGGREDAASSPAPHASADEAVAAEASAAISTAAGVVAAQRSAFPALRAELGAWRRLHGQQARSLDVALELAPVTPAPTINGARAAVAAAETRLRRTLVRGSVACEDGQLALLLGSMAAAVAMRQAAS